jgi:hypothetical protein
MFRFKVENTGFMNATDVYWKMSTGSPTWPYEESFEPFSLGVGDSIIIYPQYSYDSPGNYTPIFIIDPDDYILENNETNNNVTIPVTIS